MAVLTPLDDPDIVVYERDDPLLTLTITDLQADGSLVAYDFTDTTTLEFLVKNSPTDADEDAVARYTLTSGVAIVGLPTAGVCTVQCLSSDATLAPGIRRYQLFGVKGGLRQTLMVGKFVVRNV